MDARHRPSQGERRLRMEDVAKHAGVSQMTVSRALRTPDKVARATRERIEAAMAELHYVPDLLAGSLAARRSGLVAAVVSTFENAIFAQTIAGLTRVVEAAGYSILLGSSDYSATDEERLLRAILGRRPDGVMLTGSLHTPRARQLLRNAGVPIVETWELPGDALDMAVGFDNAAASRAMTTALHGYGYRRIVFISPADENDRRGLQRRAGYRSAAKALRMKAREVEAPGIVVGMESGPAMLAETMARYPDADAVFCSLDAIAAGVLLAAHRRGLRTPQDLAVAGFGDFAIAQPTALDLTTVHIGGLDIGTRAGEMLLARLRGDAPPKPIVDIGFSVVRRSSA